MDKGSNKSGPVQDEELKQQAEPLERSGKEGHAESHLEKESDTPSGHRIAGSGSSAEDYTYRDRGEEGGASHPKPKD